MRKEMSLTTYDELTPASDELTPVCGQDVYVT